MIKENLESEKFISNATSASVCDQLEIPITTAFDGFQIMQNGDSVRISLIRKPDIPLDRFLIPRRTTPVAGWQINDLGIMGKCKKKLTVIGLEWTTPDSTVEEYLSKYGIELVPKTAKRGRHREEPWAGLWNNERYYVVDLEHNTASIKTYHSIGGQ